MDLKVVLVITAFLVGITFAQSNQQYCRISPSHTLCRYSGIGAACNGPSSRGVSEADKREIVNIHNKLRSRVARGQESRGRPGPQNPAANMMELVWDEELAAVAQRWADQCQFGHDQSREVQRFKVGQNVYEAGSFRDEGKVDWQRGITSWYDEVKMFNRRDAANFAFSQGTGHYTQIVWAETRTVGCGTTTYRKGSFVTQYMVCNYGPTGNFLGQPMYKVGSPCSACPSGSTCTAEKLCSAGGNSGNSVAPAPSSPAPSNNNVPRPAAVPPPQPSRPSFQTFPQRPFFTNNVQQRPSRPNLVFFRPSGQRPSNRPPTPQRPGFPNMFSFMNGFRLPNIFG